MNHRHLAHTGAWAGLGFLALSGSASAQFAFNNTDMPNTATGYTENVDFGDVDNDGDWDVILADGGDFGNQQNRIWINQGNAQGGTVGVFQNRTSTQFPAVLDDSRDIEFGDFNNDGDIDVYVSNTSQIVNQSNRWWQNMGGPDGGTIGFYQDQTAARWSGLGASGSSIAPSQVLGSGGFIDFSCDCDFGDLDNDGDLDLFHSTYGGAFGGNVPMRIFLNNGTGVFSELNPSGFQLSGQNISNGNPAIWAEGTQSANTTNSTGLNADIASSTLDIEVGDIDGDFDLDLLQGARQEAPRMFVNRHEETGGTNIFRDVTGSAYPPGYTSGNGHYANELGDVDMDGDLDIYGLNWLVSGGFDDIIMKDNGAGVYGSLAVLPGSGSDDNEGDFFDYDLDGDIDLIVANFSGQERLYRNNGTGTFTLTSGVLPGDGSTSLDSDACDVDNDGDYDVVVANDGGQAEGYLKNGTAANDVTPPYIPNTEQAANRVAGPAPTVVRAQVYDNAPYYITWYNATDVEVTVNGGAPTFYPARTSQGQIFRAEIPGSLVGTISYRFRSADKYGNTAFSGSRVYTSTGGSVGTPLCFGDGTGLACPCANSGSAGRGCANSIVPAGALLTASGNPSVFSDTLVLSGVGMPNSSALYFQGDAIAGGGLGSVFGDGLRCATLSVFRLGTKFNSGNASQYPQAGDASVSVRGMVTSASTKYYQVWYRNADAAFCTPSTFNLSNALQINWTL